MMQRLQGWQHPVSLAVWDTTALRRMEHDAASDLPPHSLMQRAGDAIARIARARSRTHARSACCAAPATTAAMAWSRLQA
jgi:hypothetical protein